MKLTKKILLSGVGAAALIGAWAGGAQATPMNFSFAGTFSQDDDVQLFDFTADGSSTAYIVSYGYGGGTQADGTVHSQGGFDTILSLFDSSGSLVGSNDDGTSSCFSAASSIAGSGGNADTNTGVVYDTCFSSALSAGDYTVAVTQYDNFAVGPNLSNGFDREGEGNFTSSFTECTQGSFCDVTATPTYTNRTNEWAYDILNVASASEVTETVPEPATLGMFGIGLAGLGFAARRRRKSA